MSLAINSMNVGDAYNRVRSLTIQAQSVANLYASQLASGSAPCNTVGSMLNQVLQLLSFAQTIESDTAHRRRSTPMCSSRWGSPHWTCTPSSWRP